MDKTTFDINKKNCPYCNKEFNYIIQTLNGVKQSAYYARHTPEKIETYPGIHNIEKCRDDKLMSERSLVHKYHLQSIDLAAYGVNSCHNCRFNNIDRNYYNCDNPKTVGTAFNKGKGDPSIIKMEGGMFKLPVCNKWVKL